MWSLSSGVEAGLRKRRRLREMTDKESRLKEVEGLWKQRQYTKIFEELVKPLQEQFPDDPDVLWRLARAHYEYAEETPTDLELRETCFREAFGLASRALEQRPEDPNVVKWYAICMAGLDEFAGNKEKIEHAFTIRDHILKAIELEKEHPDWVTFYVLGRWCLSVASVGWIERKLAQSLFADPPTSTYEETLSWLQKAYELEKTEPCIPVAIGETYYAMREWSESKRWYEKAVELPTLCSNDEVQKEKAREQLYQLEGY